MTSLKHETRDSDRLTLLSRLLSYFAVGSLLFLAIGLKDIDNYINWFSFSLTMLTCGFLSGLILYKILCAILAEARDFKNSKGVGLFAPLAFTFSSLFFGAGSLLNESRNDKKDCKTYVVQELSEGGFRTKAYFIFIDNGTNRERLSFGKSFNENHQVGDTISLCIMTGRFGFKYYQINTAYNKQFF